MKYLKLFPKIGNQDTSCDFSNILLAVLANMIRQEKEIDVRIGKEEIKLSLFTNNIVVYVKTPKDSTNQLLK